MIADFVLTRRWAIVAMESPAAQSSRKRFRSSSFHFGPLITASPSCPSDNCVCPDRSRQSLPREPIYAGRGQALTKKFIAGNQRISGREEILAVAPFRAADHGSSLLPNGQLGLRRSIPIIVPSGTLYRREARRLEKVIGAKPRNIRARRNASYNLDICQFLCVRQGRLWLNAVWSAAAGWSAAEDLPQCDHEVVGPGFNE